MRPLLVIALVGGCLAVVAPAFAGTYCVHQSGSCPAGSTDSGADLQSALDSAAGTSAPDTIDIGPGSYTRSGGFTYDSANAVDVIGAGRTQTTIRGQDANKAAIKFGPTASPSSSISQLAVQAAGQQGAIGILMTGGTVREVDVTSDPAIAFGGTGVGLNAATLRNSHVEMTSDDPGYVNGVNVGASGSSEIDDSTISSPYQGVTSNGALTIHRARISGFYGVGEEGAALTIDDSLVITTPLGPNPTPFGLLVGTTYGPQASANVQNTTIVNAASGGYGIDADTEGPNSGTEIDLNNSIVWGFGTTYIARHQQDQGTSYATVIPAHDDVNGDTNGISGSDMRSVDPDFVDAAHGDYHLRFDSPLIDVSSFTFPTESSTDLDGNPRTVDVKSNGTPRDIGAYEYQHRAPVVAASVSPSHGASGQVFTFDGSASSDPDDGDSIVSYDWSFDNGAHATGPIVSMPFTSTGTHTGTLTVTDSTGLQSTRSVSVTVDPPASQQETTGTVKLSGRPHSNGKTISLTIVCSGGPCNGTFAGTTTEQLHNGSIVGLQKRAKHKKKRVGIGSKRFSLAAGQKKTITLTINSRGRALLRRFHHLPTALTVALEQPNGKLKVASHKRLTVKPAKKHKKRK